MSKKERIQTYLGEISKFVNMTPTEESYDLKKRRDDAKNNLDSLNGLLNLTASRGCPEGRLRVNSSLNF